MDWDIDPRLSTLVRSEAEASGWAQVTAPRGAVPVQDAGLRLFEVPALGLFTAVVVAAQRGQVAFAGAAALVIRNRVAQGRIASLDAGNAGAQHVVVRASTRCRRRRLGWATRLLMVMVAAASGQRVDGHREGHGPSAGWWPGARAGALHGGGELARGLRNCLEWVGATSRTAVAEGPTVVVIGDGEARTGRRLVRGQRGQIPGERWIQRPEAGEVARFIGQAKQRGQGDGREGPSRAASRR